MSAACSMPVSSRVGRGTIVARRFGNVTVLERAHATSPLRFVRPTFPGSSAAAVCLVTFGGGLVGGDTIEVDLEVDDGATLIVFTQASTKVFRGRSSQHLRARVRGTLVLLPDPVAAFAGADYTQRVDVALEGSGGCVVLDGFTSGRPAYGERWAMHALDLATTIAVDGELLVRDALRFDRRDGALGERMGRFEAAATLIAAGAPPIVDGVVAHATQAGQGGGDPDVVIAGSPLPAADRLGKCAAIARVFATSPALALAAIRPMLRNLPDIEAVDPFTSRY